MGTSDGQPFSLEALMSATESPIAHVPPPPVIRQRIGQLYRELGLLRRLLRLSQDARAHGATPSKQPSGQGVCRG